MLKDELTKKLEGKLKDDGMNVEDWLVGLANFCGHLCRRYEHMEIRAILQYVANKLKAGHTLDLVVLKEVVAKMSGIDHVDDISDAQVEMLAGGRALQIQGFLTR